MDANSATASIFHREDPQPSAASARKRPLSRARRLVALLAFCLGLVLAPQQAIEFGSHGGAGSALAQSASQPPSARPNSVRPPSTASTAADAVQSSNRRKNNITNIWGQVRKGGKFNTAVPGYEGAVLMRSQGLDWRIARARYVIPYGAGLLLIALGAVATFFMFRGRIRTPKTQTGQAMQPERTLPRFSQAERLIHWFVASTFLLLGASGPVLLFGRSIILPLIGKDAYAVLASAMMQGHNLFGPLFIVGIIAMALVYFKDNIPRREDLTWLAKGGPFFIGHAPAWKFNAGEKLWFWIAVVAGLALSLSGILLEFPQLAGSLEQVLAANLVHGIAALIMVAVAIGHIYLGTVGVEGALTTMTSGDCGEAWARHHHDLWAEELLDKEQQQPEVQSASEQATSAPVAAE